MDKLSDMLITIKNGGRVGKENVTVPYSRYKADIARSLFQEGYIKSYEKKDMKKGSVLVVDLLYKNNKPRITDVKRVSKPSRRLYASVKDITSVRQGSGSVFLSTPKGVITGKTARKEMVGGELLFEIW